jgi:hypothetical protein
MTTSRNELILDDGIEEITRVREARHRISERFGHDPYRLVAHYMERQKTHQDQLVHASPRETDNAAT